MCCCFVFKRLLICFFFLQFATKLKELNKIIHKRHTMQTREIFAISKDNTWGKTIKRNRNKLYQSLKQLLFLFLLHLMFLHFLSLSFSLTLLCHQFEQNSGWMDVGIFPLYFCELSLMCFFFVCLVLFLFYLHRVKMVVVEIFFDFLLTCFMVHAKKTWWK